LVDEMTDIVTLAIADWDQPTAGAEQRAAVRALESGSVLFLPRLRFRIADGERHLLSPAAAGRAKNISLLPATGMVRGSNADAAERALLQAMMTRFAQSSAALVRRLLPRYAGAVQQARTSYRPVEIAGRQTSWRKDDSRLHVDSFPSSPTQGRRILRVFANVDGQGRAREWRLGEPFEAVARRYIGSIAGPVWGTSLALHALGITKGRRTAYDHYMLRLHDCMKADLAYQSDAPQRAFAFPAGSAWIVFSDQVSHAAMRGQYALEQTFHLPVSAMEDPSTSPLRALERLVGRALA
jgi:hypothetical protein